MTEPGRTTGLRLDFCLNLRTNRSHISDAPPASYLTDDVSGTGYWCVRTMGVFGPDDDFVCPEACASKRPCYCSSTPVRE